MKKQILCGIMVAAVCVLSGCKSELKSLNADNIQVNTIMMREDGIVQSAIVEDFEKPHYDKDELKSFVNQAVEEYNAVAGADAVVLDYLQIQDGTARVVLSYKDLKDYADFNEVEAEDLTVQEAKLFSELPETFESADDSGSVGIDKALEDETLRVMILKEGMDVIVNGKIKYYSNGVLLNGTSCQISDGGLGVIVYKPA